MSGARHRQKDDCCEHELIERHADPLVLMSWRVWAALFAKIPRRGAS